MLGNTVLCNIIRLPLSTVLITCIHFYVYYNFDIVERSNEKWRGSHG